MLFRSDAERLSRDERAWRLQANRRAVDNYTADPLRGGGAPGVSEAPSMLPPPKDVPDPLERLSSGTGSPRIDLQSAPQGLNNPPANAGQSAAMLPAKP